MKKQHLLVRRTFLLSTLLTIVTSLGCIAQPPGMTMMGMRGGWQSPESGMKKDTLWGAYCYREIDQQISGVSRIENPFTELPLRQGEQMIYYVLADKCTSSLQLFLSTEKKAQPLLSVTVKEVNTGKVVARKQIKTKFSGGQARTYVMQMTKLPSKSWYRIELTAQDWLAINSIDYFVFEHDSPTPIKPSPIFMAPSVHLNGWESTDPNAPKGEAYDWAYMEVMLPKKYECKNTYVMSLGVLSGYMGIQVIDDHNTRDYKHRVLFSMWDQGNTDEDANLPDYLRSGALDHDNCVEIERFGGEGTGTKSMIYESHWQCDNWVQFITTCRPEVLNVKVKGANGGDSVVQYTNTLVSAWYKEANEKEWHYLSTLREASRNHYMSGWYSFLENFTDDGGNIYRRAYFRNGFFHSQTDNKWYHRNKVGFGHTQGAPDKPRYDYGHGATSLYPNAFYLEQGGYTLNANDSATTLPLTTDYTPVDTINLQALWNRVEQAVCKESTVEMDLKITAASEQPDKLQAFKNLAKEYIDNAGRFDYYAKEDLRDVENIYNAGQTTDAAGLAMYLRELARFCQPLKHGKPIKTEHIGLTHAYQIKMANGQTLVADGNATTLASDRMATDNRYNWQFARQGNTNRFVVRNMATGLYLSPSAQTLLSTAPTEVTIELAKDAEGFIISTAGHSLTCTLVDNYYINHIK